jgi:branched-chain amino acid transport system permease protein
VSRASNGLRARITRRARERNPIVYAVLLVGALTFPTLAGFISNGDPTALISQAADAGVYVLLAIGLNVVVGFAGLLDLGYAAFFAIGAYTAGMLASGQLGASPLHHEVHIPFWIVLFLGMFFAASFGAILGAPTLRLRGDYLAIVTLGFGEIVPRVFRNMGFGSPLGNWTSGINGINALDRPQLPFWFTGPWVNQPFSIVQKYDFGFDPVPFYVLMVILVIVSVILVNNLQRSRMGRAWMAVREDEVAAAAMGVNTVTTKLLAFGIGAAFSGFAGAYYGTKLSLVGPDAFSFVVSVTVLVMVVLGGMGNIPGVIVGALLIYYILFNFLGNLPDYASSLAQSVGLGFLNQPNFQRGWPGLSAEVQLLPFLIFGLILVTIMLLRPQGLLPSRSRAEELRRHTEEEQPVVAIAETTAH